MTSGNPILDKNLESIEKYNPALKEKLLNLPYLANDIQLIETELQESNLSYNGLPLHSQSGAELEAKAIFDNAQNEGVITHFVLGMGLGYLFKEFCERAKGTVILYESNLEILRVTLELVDFSKELAQANVRVASDFYELKEIYYGIYEYKSKVNFALLETYKNIYAEEAQKILNQIAFINKSLLVDFMHIKGSAMEYLSLTFDNLFYTLNAIPLCEIRDIYKGKTALIVSAGPTLDANIEAIKKNRDKFIIFCVGTALKSLVKNEIAPDFLNVLEKFDCSGQVNGIDLSNINLILEPSTNTSFHKLKVKQKFIYPSCAGQWGKYWGELTNTDTSPYMSCGTVSYQALYSAKILGFRKIILVGQDLAFVNQSCYSKDSAYSDIVFEVNPTTQKPEYKIKNYENYLKSLATTGDDKTEQWSKDFAQEKLKKLNNNLCFVKGIQGEMLPTETGLSIFLDRFKEFAFANKDLELINTSLIGAQIDGFENVPLEQALQGVSPIDKIQIESSFSFDKQKVLQNLKKDKQRLQEISSEIKKAKEYIYKYEREIKASRGNTQDATKYFQQFLAIYRNIYSKHYATDSLYNLISFNENTELQYETRSETDKNKIFETWHRVLKNYYGEVDTKISEIIGKIDKNIESISSQ